MCSYHISRIYSVLARRRYLRLVLEIVLDFSYYLVVAFCHISFLVTWDFELLCNMLFKDDDMKNLNR